MDSSCKPIASATIHSTHTYRHPPDGSIPIRGASYGAPEKDEELQPSMMPYARNLVRGELCAFTLGHFAHLAETTAGVKSFAQFMPGMRVVVGVDPENFFAFNR